MVLTSKVDLLESKKRLLLLDIYSSKSYDTFKLPVAFFKLLFCFCFCFVFFQKARADEDVPNRSKNVAFFNQSASNLKLGTRETTGRGDQVACSCLHENGFSDWIGILLFFFFLSLLWLQRIVSYTLRTQVVNCDKEA